MIYTGMCTLWWKNNLKKYEGNIPVLQQYVKWDGDMSEMQPESVVWYHAFPLPHQVYPYYWAKI